MTLVDGMRDAGSYNVVWNAEGFSAGVYFVSMKDEVGSMKGMRKVVLVK